MEKKKTYEEQLNEDLSVYYDEKTELNKNKDFVQINIKYQAELMQLAIQEPVSMTLFLLFISRMERNNTYIVSKKEMAECVHKSVRSIDRAINRLVENNFLVIIKYQRSNVYFINPQIACSCSAYQKKQLIVQLGDVKPFAVMRNAEINNLDDMTGYGLPKLWGAIPALKIVDLSYNVLFSDLDKAEKIILINELLCEFDENGKPRLTTEQKKLFVFTGTDKLPDEKGMIQEYNPEIRIEQITKAFELALSLLSMSFGYGTKKYSFENGQITTATEYIGERQDQMQELNRQRQEAIRYIQDICKAVMWFANTFQGKSYNLEQDIIVDFDDSYITDKEAELERKRNDALSFEIPELTVWYLMDAYSLTEEEARGLVKASQEDKQSEIEEDD